jgi:lactate permease
MTWTQAYTPLADSIALSALVAALPVATLLALLAFWRVRASGGAAPLRRTLT